MSKKPAAEKKAQAPAQKQDGGAAAAQGGQPGIQVVSQYIRDLSFENPNVPESLVGGWGQPDTNVQIFLRHRAVQENTYDCSVNFKVEAKKKGEDKTFFVIELAYGALVILRGVPQENHQAVVLVEVPKLLFPFAREIVATVTAQGGYPPLYLTPVSFETIYMNEVKRAQEKQKASGGKA